MSTTFAALSTENRTKEKLSALGCSINCFADICHVHRSTMAAHFSGSKPMDPRKSERLLEVAGLMQKLVSILPVKPSFHPDDAEQVREALIKLEHDELDVTVVDRSNPNNAGLRALATRF